MDDAALRDARRALMRLRRSIEKAERELDAAVSYLASASDGGDPHGAEEARAQIEGVRAFLEEQLADLQRRVLDAGGIALGHDSDS